MTVGDYRRSSLWSESLHPYRQHRHHSSYPHHLSMPIFAFPFAQLNLSFRSINRHRHSKNFDKPLLFCRLPYYRYHVVANELLASQYFWKSQTSTHYSGKKATTQMAYSMPPPSTILTTLSFLPSPVALNRLEASKCSTGMVHILQSVQ